MENIAASFIALPIFMIFLTSGLLTNFLQVLLFIIVLPFSRNTYRKANICLIGLLWSELVWLVQWWAGLKIRFYTDSRTWQLLGKEHALLISNHYSDIDWLLGWVLAEHFGCLGSIRAVMKKSSKFLPVFGWSTWFAECIFLDRNWQKDEARLKAGYQNLKSFPSPCWLGLFVEGTRFTSAKLLAAQEYARSAGLPVPRNLLLPRTKGFVSAVTNLRSSVPAIYDITVAIPKDEPKPTMLRLLKGQSSVVHVHVKRHVMSDLPESGEGIAQWCRDTFTSKDNLLEKHKIEKTFGEHLYQPIHRPVKPLVVVVSWSAILLLAFSKIVWPHVRTGANIVWSVVFVCIVTLLMYILIAFSQSERSITAKSSQNGSSENALRKREASGTKEELLKDNSFQPKI